MIHILTTGGTIEGLDYEKKIIAPEEIKITINDFLSSANVSFNYTIENAFRKDSRFITQCKLPINRTA